MKQNLKAWNRKMAVLVERGDATAVMAAAEAISQSGRGDTQTMLVAGRALESVGEVEAAISTYRKALRSASGDEQARPPTYWKVHYQLYGLLVAEGRLEEALEFAGPPETPREVQRRAEILRQLGRQDEAIDELRAALELNPRNRWAREELVLALRESGREAEAEAAERSAEQIPPKITPAEAVRRIDAADPDGAERYVVNIGCRDGQDMGDPCYELYQAGYPGLAIDAGSFPALFENLPQESVRKLIGTKLTPANVCEVLRREGCPERPSLLKIDIDSFDGPLLEAALADFVPDVVHIELNPEIPPPIQFTIQYDPRYKHSGYGGFYGCSLAYVLAVARPRGYELLELDLSLPPRRQDALLVRTDYLSLWNVQPPVDEREAFLREPPVRGEFRRLGIDSRPWRAETDYDRLLSVIWDACVTASLARSGTVLPFVLTR